MPRFRLLMSSALESRRPSSEYILFERVDGRFIVSLIAVAEPIKPSIHVRRSASDTPFSRRPSFQLMLGYVAGSSSLTFVMPEAADVM